MKSIILVLTIIIAVSATDWLEPVELGNPEKVLGTSFSGDNMRIYCSKRNGSVYHGDIKYYEWNGSSWVDMGWIDGDVNTFDSEAEPFITYDGQSLYFQRSGDEYGIYVADWVEGSGFINSRKLGSQISNYGGHYPSVTQDGQKLYFASSHKIYESTWNGSDWEEAVLMPDEINGGGGIYRSHVTISPDGKELYFVGAGPYYYWLACSKKVNGEWQQWEYCGENINPIPPDPFQMLSCPALTYAPYETQELYFNRGGAFGKTYHALRSPIVVKPCSVGNIKALYR